MESTACGSTRISCVRGSLKLSGVMSRWGSGFPDLPGHAPSTAIPTECHACPLAAARSWARNTHSAVEELWKAMSTQKGIR